MNTDSTTRPFYPCLSVFIRGQVFRQQSSWPQRVEGPQRTRARQVFARPHQLRDLPDVPQIVQRPFVQHLRQGDRSHLLVNRLACAGARRQLAQRFDVGLALFLEMIEGILGIHVAIQLQVLLRVVARELRILFAQEPVQARAVAVSLGVAQVRQHLAYREPAGRGIPAHVLGGEFGHQAAQNRRRGFQQIEAGQSIVLHGTHPTMFSPPSTWIVLPVIQYVAGWQSTAMQRATSSGVVSRLLGLRSCAISISFSCPGMRRSAGVSVTPARMALAVMPAGASSNASCRMCASSMALAALTGPYSGMARVPPELVMAKMRAPLSNNPASRHSCTQ